MRKDIDLQIQRGGYHFWIIMPHSHLSNYLLCRISKFKQAKMDTTAFPAWLKVTPFLYQKGCQNTSKEKRETNSYLIMLWQESNLNHASKAKLPKGKQKRVSICSLYQPFHKGGQKQREMQHKLPVSLQQTACPAACTKFRADLS